MKTIDLTLSYELKWQLKSAPNYQFTNDGICVNLLRGKVVRKILVNSTKGYCINGRFKSVKALRGDLQTIPKQTYPF
jgi:hypothetical protein